MRSEFEPGPPTLGVQSPSHCTAREVPVLSVFNFTNVDNFWPLPSLVLPYPPACLSHFSSEPLDVFLENSRISWVGYTLPHASSWIPTEALLAPLCALPHTGLSPPCWGTSFLLGSVVQLSHHPRHQIWVRSFLPPCLVISVYVVYFLCFACVYIYRHLGLYILFYLWLFLFSSMICWNLFVPRINRDRLCALPRFPLALWF